MNLSKSWLAIIFGGMATVITIFLRKHIGICLVLFTIFIGIAWFKGDMITYMDHQAKIEEARQIRAEQDAKEQRAAEAAERERQRISREKLAEANAAIAKAEQAKAELARVAEQRKLAEAKANAKAAEMVEQSKPKQAATVAGQEGNPSWTFTQGELMQMHAACDVAFYSGPAAGYACMDEQKRQLAEYKAKHATISKIVPEPQPPLANEQSEVDSALAKAALARAELKYYNPNLSSVGRFAQLKQEAENSCQGAFTSHLLTHYLCVKKYMKTNSWKVNS